MSGSFNWASLIAPALTAGASIYGATQANRAAKLKTNALQQAAQTQSQGTEQQLALMQQALAQQGTAQQNQTNLLSQMYQQGRADLEPYRAAGNAALANYAGQVNTPFEVSPGYQFAQDEGMRAILANRATRGALNSGGTLRAVQQYGQGLANQEYGNYLSRLSGLATMGQNAAAGQAAQAQGYGTNAANVMGAGANANSAIYGNMAGAVGSGNNALVNLLVGQGAANASGANASANALMGGANNLLAYFMGR